MRIIAITSQITFFTCLCKSQSLSQNHTNSTSTNPSAASVSCLEQSEAYTSLFDISRIYTMIFVSLIFLCSIFYYIKLVINRTIYVKHGSLKSYIKTYILTGWKFKSMYGSLFTQLFDQVSDISVILQLYYLSNQEDEENGTLCHHMNAYKLFLASSFVFLFYRFLSSFLIYRLLSDSHSPFLYKIFLTILQFFDLSFILTLKINYQFQNITPCNPQRYITNLEAIFEAAPQFIIQLFFIITLNMKQNNSNFDIDSDNNNNRNTNTNLIVAISLFFSLMSIVSKKLSQDKECVNLKWQNVNFSWKQRADKELAAVQAIKVRIEKEKRKGLHEFDVNTINEKQSELQQNVYRHNVSFFCCSLNIKYYIHRIIWRIFTIMHRLILWTLIWRIIGGFWFIGCILFEFAFYAMIYFFTCKNVFFESIMGHVLQNIKFAEKSKKYAELKERDKSFLCIYICLRTAIYSIALCILFVLSELNTFYCCVGMNISSFFIEFVIFAIFCFSCCVCFALKKHVDAIEQVFLILCSIHCYIMFILVLFFFNYYAFICLIFDFIVLSIYTVKKDETHPLFIRLCVYICAPVGINCAMLSFRFIADVCYCLCLVFFTFYSSNINILFVNDYNETVYYLFWNDNDDDTAVILFIVLLSCCVLSFVLPLWTYYLVYYKKIINGRASNERKLSSMSSSGDIYGICEIIEFAGINYSTTTQEQQHDELRKYLQECIRTDNFRYTIFASLKFFQQYQIMKYLSDTYNVTIDFFESVPMTNALKKHVDSKEFSYQFKNNNQLLMSYMNNCFDLEDRASILSHAVAGDHVECIYPAYLEHLINVPINSINRNGIASMDVNNISADRLLYLINIAENKLNNCENNATIKNLLFRNIKQKQWKELNKNINKTIFKYWAFVFEKVMFLFVFVCICNCVERENKTTPEISSY